MSTPFSLKLIAAVSIDGYIGKGNDLPWPRIPGDMLRFKSMTSDNLVIMGRKTLESMGGPLKNRLNVVVTRDSERVSKYGGIIVKNNFEEALDYARTLPNLQIYTIGGRRIFAESLEHPNCDELLITRVHQNYPLADVRFPKINKTRWKLVTTEGHREQPIPYSFELWRKIA